MSEKSKKAGIRLIRVIDLVTDVAIEIALVALLVIGAYCLWDSQQVYQAADASNYTAYRPEPDDTKSFEELRKINPEVFGWLTVNDTPIDYPVTQADNNEKYINTNAEGQYTLSGSIFLDYRNSPSFDDFNSILYGHHMEQKMMFGSLSDFSDEKYFDSHPYGNLYFDGRNHGLEFFALILADAYDSSLFAPGISDEGRRAEYLSYLQSTALWTRDISVTTDDQIILLSTCTTDITNGRYLLAGKISDELHLQQKEKAKTVIRHVEGPGRYMKGLISVPVIVWIMLALLLIIILIVSGKRHNRKKLESVGENENET